MRRLIARLIYRPALKYWFILIFAGPGQGKSVEQAFRTYRLFREYKRTEGLFPELPHRIYCGNQDIKKEGFLVKKSLFRRRPHLTMEFINAHFFYWSDYRELQFCVRARMGIRCWRGDDEHLNHDVDIGVDEGANLFPSDGWLDTELWLRVMWNQHRHRGIRWMVLSVDYMQIDINARRVVWRAYHMKKRIGSRDISVTLPPLSRWSIMNVLSPNKEVVWGFYTFQEFDPIVLKLDTLALLTLQTSEKKKEVYHGLGLVGRPRVRFITWFKINLFDTTEDVASINHVRK